MESEVSKAIDAMADDMISAATIVSDRLENVQGQPIKRQNDLLKELFLYLNDTINVETLKAIAWDMVQPLSVLWLSESTRCAADDLLRLIIQQGHQREVLLKVIETIENLDTSEDIDDGQQRSRLIFKLLEAQEDILCRIKTLKPLNFMKEYVKSILTAAEKLDALKVAGSELELRDFVTQIFEHGSVCKFKKSENLTAQDAVDLHFLLQNLLTQVTACIARCSSSCAQELAFDESRCSERRPARPTAQTDEFHAWLQDIYVEPFIEVVQAYFTSTEELWSCAAGRTDHTALTKDEDTIDPSREGSVILLAMLIDSTAEDKRPELIDVDKLELCNALMIRQCACGLENRGVVVASLYISAFLITSLNKRSNELNESPEMLQLIQGLAYISAMSTEADVRSTAYHLARQALHKTGPQFRMTYYLGLMSDCPFVNLKIATIGMIKDEYTSSAEYWQHEANSSKLFSLLTDSDLTNLPHDEVDESKEKYCIQLINCIILVLQRRQSWQETSSRLARCVRFIETNLHRAQISTPLVKDLLEMHITRAKQLLPQLVLDRDKR